MDATQERTTAGRAAPPSDRRHRARLRTIGIIGTAIGFITVTGIVAAAAIHERKMKLVPLGVEDLRRERSAPHVPVVSPPANPTNTPDARHPPDRPERVGPELGSPNQPQ